MLFIPKSQMITLELAYDSKTVRLADCRRSELLSPKHCLLSIYLLEQKHCPTSAFKYYIEVLPKEHPSFPIYYSQAEMDELRGSHFYEQVEQKRLEIRRDYDTIREIDPAFQFAFGEFCWARMTVCSRVFGINVHDTKTDALVPLADMLNHRVPRQTSWSYCDVREGFVIESMENIEPGSQIFDSYGKKCNSRFLLNYGFILASNDSNEVVVPP